MTTVNIPALKALTEAAELRVNHMYLDTKGIITAAVGHVIGSLDEARKLPFAPASALATDWARLLSSEPGHTAAYYGRIVITRLPESAIDAILDVDVNKFLAGLEGHLPQFPTYPEPAQQAVFDIAFNTGLGGFAQFKHLRASLDARNWAACATQCHRKDISDRRNARTAELFRTAAERAMFGVPTPDSAVPTATVWPVSSSTDLHSC